MGIQRFNINVPSSGSPPDPLGGELRKTCSMSRDELVKLVERIVTEGPNVGGQCDEWLSILEDNVPDPNVSDYIFWP